MKIDVMTLFPEMFSSLTDHSIIKRAIQNNLLEFKAHDIRAFSTNKHKQADDYPYGGGAGMVMTPQPIFDCMDTICQNTTTKPIKIYLSPRGTTLTSSLAQALAQEQHLLLLCGHYEGVDERVIDQMDMQISIGDYILTGGELPAMVLVDSISRFIPGVLGSDDSAFDESFSDGLLEYPQYTRPSDFRGMKVPEILLSGHHAKIVAWQRQQALLLTAKHRPDLLAKANLTEEEKTFLRTAQIVLQD